MLARIVIAALSVILLAAPALPQTQQPSGQAQGQSQAQPGKSGNVWPTAPGSESLEQRKAKAEEKGRELKQKLSDDEELARRYVRPGMGVAEVRELLGDPRGATVSDSSGRFVCLGYGRVWVVFEDGQVSCLRSRLVYAGRYDSI